LTQLIDSGTIGYQEGDMRLIFDEAEILLTLDEAQERLPYSRTTFFRRLKAGEIKTVKDCNRTYVPLSEIRRLKEGKCQTLKC